MAHTLLNITRRITRPTIAKATVTGSIRFENEQFEGRLSWVRLSLIRCCDCAS